MTRFYRDVMGFFITDKGLLSGRDLTFLSRDPKEHHQVVLVGGKDEGVQQNINQISFRLKSLSELQTLYKKLVNLGVKGIDPVTHGNSWSMYFMDPEGNRLEAFTDSEWYISQPLKEPLDLTLPESTIREQTKLFCQNRPGFKPLSKWHDEMRELMKIT